MELHLRLTTSRFCKVYRWIIVLQLEFVFPFHIISVKIETHGSVNHY